ncbi:MAG: 4-hydroxy-3-methylbut-2-enyl diphosphate reductase, partial [Thermoleophilia bacterium]|nr:4-hydroxy-3-methylbut-2-enyl diphosphate reductase [Thermoleophilia bacterium]
VVLIGHEGHEEVVGTMGEAPDATVLVQTVEEAEALDLPADTRLAYVTQTTLSVDETGEIITTLRRRFPEIRAPRKEDICYATSNRQWAVKEMLPEIDLLLVIGSRNSSNSNRLVETARAAGTHAYLIDDETEIDEAWLDGAATVGITSGASAPEKLVTRVCDWFRARGVTEIEPYRIVEEDVTFRLPVELLAAHERAQVVEHARARRVRWRDELGQPRRRLLVERDGSASGAGLVPDAEADATLGHVAGDAQGLVLVGISPQEELDELAPLWRGAPGAIAVRAHRLAPTLRAVHHARSIRPPAWGWNPWSGFLNSLFGATPPQPPRLVDEAGRGRQLRDADKDATAEAA